VPAEKLKLPLDICNSALWHSRSAALRFSTRPTFQQGIGPLVKQALAVILGGEALGETVWEAQPPGLDVFAALTDSQLSGGSSRGR
jgi:hypothetical protein